MEDVMGMMEKNEEGKLEFPRDLMVEDCFSSGFEPLYGFVTNVTIPEDMLDQGPWTKVRYKMNVFMGVAGLVFALSLGANFEVVESSP